MACSPQVTGATATTTPSTLTSVKAVSTTIEPGTLTSVAAVSTTIEPDQGDLVGWDTTRVVLDERELWLARANSEAERAQGLTGVAHLGDLDGMLFEWDGEVITGFWMKDTLIALDIAFFDRDGALVDQTSLTPCESDPCPVYVASTPFRWAIESEPGRLALSPNSRLLVDP